jgi:hypothetical protein
MSTKQRPSEPRPNTATTGGGDSEGSGHAELREQASNLLDVADQAINRVLETDSSQYLTNRLQRGGQ